MGLPVRVFLNSKSGTACTESDLRALFEKYDCPCEFSPIKKSLDAGALARSDPAETAYLAAGGDGTVNLVAAAVAGTARRMGVLPVGTLNHFAKDLHLPLELDPAVEAVAQGDTQLVDSAEVNGEIFVNNSSLGFYPTMVQQRERMKKAGGNKWAALVAASVKAFLRFRCLTVTFVVEGETRHCTTPFLFVGNNEYCVEGSHLGQRDHVDRGLLSLYLAPGATRATMLRFAAAAAIGRLKELTDFHEYTTTEFTVTTRRPRSLRVSLDGEVRRLQTPLTYKIHPKNLHVLKVSAES